MTAALVLGLITAPVARAGCDPVYDPGSACPGTFQILIDPVPGAEAYAHGRFAKSSAQLSSPTHVMDTADDGLDAHLWVLYGAAGGEHHEESIAVASGAGTRTEVEWSAPAGVVVHYFQARVCVGPGEDRCSRWVG